MEYHILLGPIKRRNTTMENIAEEGIRPFNVIIIFFSATGNTRKVADVIEKKLSEFNVSVTQFDISSPQDRNRSISFSDYDAVFFGFPIYSLRAPRVCREWLLRQNGESKRCSVFFTYGGFGKEPAHYYIKELLEERNFSLVSTAEFLGAHTFNYSGWQAAQGRPDPSDLKIAEEYTIKTLERFRADDLITVTDFEKPPFPPEQLDEAEKYRFHLITQLPTRDGKECCLCMQCEELCPTGSMDAVKGVVNPESCIACFRCIASCPEGVLHTNDIANSWENKLKMHNTTKEEIDRMESRIFL
jgi:ferredoxin/menaquinone-dependent protoporphyrinogen IX oxidase